MRRVFITGLLFIIFFPAAINASEFCKSFYSKETSLIEVSLEKALKTAFEKNPMIKEALAEIDRARADDKIAASGFMPEISTYMEYSRGDSPSSYLFKKIDQRKLPGDTNFNDPGTFENYESGISAKMRLFNGGRTSLMKDISGMGVEAGKFAADEAKNNIAFLVISLWYDILTSRDMVNIAAESVETVEEQVRVTEIKFKGGSALKSDLLSLKARLSASKEKFLYAANNCRLLRARLVSVMGLDPETEIKAVKSTFQISSLPDDYNSLVEKAVTIRPYYRIYKKKLEMAALKYKREKRTYLPTLDFKADYYLDDPDMEFSAKRENYRAGLVLNWKLFDGFSREASIDKAGAELEIAGEKTRKALLDLKLEIRKAFFDMDLSKKRLEVVKMQKKEAEASFDLVKKQFSGGSVSITRYLEAELSRNRARIAERKAYYENKKARAGAARSVGLLFSF